MRIGRIIVPLFCALTASVFILSLFPTTVRTYPVDVKTRPVERAVILSQILSGYTVINEGVEHILAVPELAREWAVEGFLNHIYPGLEHIRLIGRNFVPDPEQILYLQPDAVFVYTVNMDLLRKIGLPRLIETQTDSKNPIQSREKIWRQIGEVVGKSTRATALLDKYSAKRDALHRQLASHVTRRKRVVYVHVNNGNWFTTNSNYYIAYKLELAGAKNISNFKFTAKADLEHLLRIDPDIILFASNPGDRTTLQEIVGKPEFQSLRAVRQGRIYKMPLHTFMNELVEDRLLLTWMAEVFYPDIMARRLREEYKEVYQEVYGYSISDDEIDGAIYLEENRHSQGYERFVKHKAGS